MLIPVTRTPSFIARTFVNKLAPPVTSLCSHFPATRKLDKFDAPKTSPDTDPNHSRYKTSTVKPAASSAAYPRISGLFGLRNTEKLIGPSVLRYVMSRNFSGTCATKIHAAAPTDSRTAYVSAIKFLEPEFLKAGLIKVYENNDNVIFSVGTDQSLRIIMDSTKRRAIALHSGLFFRDKYGTIHALHNLMNQLAPETYIENICVLNPICRNHGLVEYDTDTPQTKREEGARIYALLLFRQVISFLETHKKALSELTPTRASASPKSVREPYGSVFKFLEPEFLKAGFFKTLEDDETVRFSIGSNQFLSIAVLPNSPPSISLIFFGDKFNPHYLSELMKKFEPVKFEKGLLDLNAIIQKYRLNDEYTPKEIREEGVRIYLLVILRQAMRFVESNRKALAELYPAEIPASLTYFREPYGSAIQFQEPQFASLGCKLSEPYGSVIKLLEPEFLKNGFIKTHETGHKVRFSFGTNQFFEIETGRNTVSSIAAFYFDETGNQNYVSFLMKKFDPAAFEKNCSDQNAIRKKYGLDDKNTPLATRDEGGRIYLSLLLRQIISFLDANKKVLGEKTLFL